MSNILNLLSPHNPKPSVKAVIFDLDGTLLNTEQPTITILKDYLARYGKKPNIEKEKKRLGMTQKESVIAIVQDYNLPLTPTQYAQEILPFYKKMWRKAKPLAGSNRLMQHLRMCDVPFALASNTSRKNLDLKLSYQCGWKECFSCVIGSDDVERGKPAPDMFLEAAKKMGFDADDCLVIEDSIVGVEAAKAAGMNVVIVPSLHVECSDYCNADSMLHSLLDFRPEVWGLTPFGSVNGLSCS